MNTRIFSTDIKYDLRRWPLIEKRVQKYARGIVKTYWLYKRNIKIYSNEPIIVKQFIERNKTVRIEFEGNLKVWNFGKRDYSSSPYSDFIKTVELISKKAFGNKDVLWEYQLISLEEEIQIDLDIIELENN